MSELYTVTNQGEPPVTVVEFKDFRKLPQTINSQNGVITTILDAATAYGEAYTGKDFRDNVYTLRLDDFPTGCPILIHRSPVASITSITYLVDDVVTTLDPATYYMLPNLQEAEVLLAFDKSWPTDGDGVIKGRQGSIVVTFVTKAFSCDGRIRESILEHANALYSERGDCSSGAVRKAAATSGATDLYDQYRTARI